MSDQRDRRAGRLRGRDLVASVLLGGGFLAAALPLALGAGRVDVPLAAALAAAYAIASRVEFEIGFGVAVPTQLVFVPLLLALPPGIAPLLVAAGFVLGELPGVVRGRTPWARALVPAISAWHAVGPAAVLLVAGGDPLAWRRWPVWLAALGAQIALDLATTELRRVLVLGRRARPNLRELGAVWLVDAGLSPVGLLAVLASVRAGGAGPGATRFAPLLVLPLVVLLAAFARERRARFDHAIELSHAYRGTALLLGDLIEADDEYTGNHSRDVVALTLLVADELGLGPRDRRDAEFVALLHDVGKVHVPNEIINKPGPLTAEERAIVNLHTVWGEEMLDRVGGVLSGVGRVVRSCHERWDGGGYPDGLAGEAIPLLARIVCCTDAFNAMTTDRSYRRARSHEEAVAELRCSAGSHFDPVVVEALVAAVERERAAVEPGAAPAALAPGPGLAAAA